MTDLSSSFRDRPPACRALPPIPVRTAGAEPDHAAGALRRPDGDPLRPRRQARIGARRHRVRRRARRHRRADGAPAQGHVAFRRRTRQARRLRQFRRRARADPLFLGACTSSKSAGWIAALVFAISAGLRLARFNVMIDDPNRPAWAGNFFTGMPAPAGAITVLLPIYLDFLGLPELAVVAPVAFSTRWHRVPDGRGSRSIPARSSAAASRPTWCCRCSSSSCCSSRCC